MTSRLPFGLNTKPIRRCVPNHSLSYRVSNGKLFCLVRKTTIRPVDQKVPLYEFEVKTKEQLDKLLQIENISELQTIEGVAN